MRDPLKAKARKQRYLERQKIKKFGPDAAGKDMRGRHGNRRDVRRGEEPARVGEDQGSVAQPRGGDDMTAEEEANAAFEEAWDLGRIDSEYKTDARGVWCTAWLASREATAKRCVEICLGAYGGPAHTYASENADLYRTQDRAVKQCAAVIEREFLK